MANENAPFLVKAIYAFKGSNNDELNFRKGDIITVTQVLDGGWWEGTLHGITGWFPSNYVKEHKPDLSTRKKSPPDTKFTDSLNNRQDSMRMYRNMVLKDMMDSERAHLTDLQNLFKQFLKPLQTAEIAKDVEYQLLVGNFEEVIECHQKLLISLEECAELPAKQQRIGGLYMQIAPQLKALHLTYCANHPQAVTVLEKYRDDLSGFMESHGAPNPGIMVLTTGLSKAFRRLEKYPGLLQELERHMEESHVDRGDTQRAIHIYRDIASSCMAVRRQREMELEVMNSSIRGWEGEEISTLGDILLMTSVSVSIDNREKKDRYFVLFPHTLVMLSVSPRMSAFLYEGKLPLSGISVSPLEDSDSQRYALEITGLLIERIAVSFPTKEDQEHWVEFLRQHIRISRASTPAKHQPLIPYSGTPPPVAPHEAKSQSSSSSLTNLNKVPFRSPNRVWTLSCLRPAPPLRPCLALGVREETTNRRASSRPQRRKDERSHDDDAQILRVIEAYCTSAKTRYTVNSALLDCPQMLIAEEEKIIIEETSGCETVMEEKSLVDTVYALKDQVKELKQETTALSKSLEEEYRARKRLENLFHEYVVLGKDDKTGMNENPLVNNDFKV